MMIMRSISALLSEFGHPGVVVGQISFSHRRFHILQCFLEVLHRQGHGHFFFELFPPLQVIQSFSESSIFLSLPNPLKFSPHGNIGSFSAKQGNVRSRISIGPSHKLFDVDTFSLFGS